MYIDYKENKLNRKNIDKFQYLEHGAIFFSPSVDTTYIPSLAIFELCSLLAAHPTDY